MTQMTVLMCSCSMQRHIPGVRSLKLPSTEVTVQLLMRTVLVKVMGPA